MAEWIWLNGRVMPLGEGRVEVEDRGFQFADGVYEVVRFYGGRAFALREHLDRLERSCGGIRLAMPMGKEALAGEIRGLIGKSGLAEGMVYLQLTRGSGPRSHAMGGAGKFKPTLLFYARGMEAVGPAEKMAGVKLLSTKDIRWQCCWIKSIALLPNVLAKSAAVEAGADEAVFIHEGVVTECSASNLFIVKGRELITHPVGEKVLPGITRQVLLEIAPEVGLEAVERGATEAEAKGADEVFITSTTRHVNWVSQWDGKSVGKGRCGEAARRLGGALMERIGESQEKEVRSQKSEVRSET